MIEISERSVNYRRNQKSKPNLAGVPLIRLKPYLDGINFRGQGGGGQRPGEDFSDYLERTSKERDAWYKEYINRDLSVGAKKAGQAAARLIGAVSRNKNISKADKIDIINNLGKP